jgi:hypothetical protein
MNQEEHVSLRDHLIVAMELDQDLDTAQIAQLAISQAILSADLEIPNRVQIQESMTATETHTVKTESQETNLAIQVLLALATRTQTAKLSLRTRF